MDVRVEEVIRVLILFFTLVRILVVMDVRVERLRPSPKWGTVLRVRILVVMDVRVETDETRSRQVKSQNPCCDGRTCRVMVALSACNTQVRILVVMDVRVESPSLVEEMTEDATRQNPCCDGRTCRVLEPLRA